MDSMYSDDEDDYDGDNDDDGDGDNDDNDVIIISSEDEGENDNNDVHSLLNFMLNYVPESPEHINNSLQEYSNNLVRSILTPTSRPTRRPTRTSASAPLRSYFIR